MLRPVYARVSPTLDVRRHLGRPSAANSCTLDASLQLHSYVRGERMRRIRSQQRRCRGWSRLFPPLVPARRGTHELLSRSWSPSAARSPRSPRSVSLGVTQLPPFAVPVYHRLCLRFAVLRLFA